MFLTHYDLFSKCAVWNTWGPVEKVVLAGKKNVVFFREDIRIRKWTLDT
jgi:hypothetical protein